MKAIGTKTYSATAIEARATQRWYVIDAEGQVLGRLASTIARIIRGKGKPTFTPHMDGGDYVIVINADKVVVTGNKEEDKVYYRHSGYPGGLTTTRLKDMRAKHPERLVEKAVRGMLPRTKLGERIYLHLKVYAGPNHPHESQKPEKLDLWHDGHHRGRIMRSTVPAVAVEDEAEEARHPVDVADVLASADEQAPTSPIPTTHAE
jgi:large subunit ribosomal protein L13